MRGTCRDGFTGKMAIHPAQVPIINEVFAPTARSPRARAGDLDAFAKSPRGRRGRHRWRHVRPPASGACGKIDRPCGFIRGAALNDYRVGHGMIGTVLIAFAGEPLIILVLIAR